MTWKDARRRTALLAFAVTAGCGGASPLPVGPPAAVPALSAEGEAAQARCSGGDNRACAELGRMYLRGLGATRDLAAAARTLQPACEAGNAGACADLGEVYVERRQPTADLQLATRLFHTACDRGSAQGCARFARSLLHGVGVAPDQQRALDLMRRVCAQGEPEGCLNLGAFHMGGGGGTRDHATALRWFEAAVARGGGHGTLALMYWNGYGVKRDAERARILLQTGCDQGDAAACLNLGIMCQLGEGGETDHDGAVAHFRRACQLGAERGCAGLSSR